MIPPPFLPGLYYVNGVGVAVAVFGAPGHDRQWPGPKCFIDPTGGLGDDNNSGLDAQHPLKTYGALISYFGVFGPSITQNLAIIFLSSHPTNPAVDQVMFTPRVQNGAQVSMQGTLVQTQTGTLGGVVALSRSSPGQRLTATFGAGLSQPTLVLNNTRGSYAWIDTNTGGNTWTLTEPLNQVGTVPPSGNGPDDTWTTGDSYTAYVPTVINLRLWAPSWEDITDGNPDSRPTLYACQVGLGTNLGAGVDTAQCRIQLDGSVMYQVAVISSTSINQQFYTHGSRAAGQVVNCFGCDSSARTSIIGLINTTSPTASGEGKLISIVGGRFSDGLYQNVVMSNDFTMTANGRCSGAVLYDNICIDGSTYAVLEHGHAAPLSGNSTIYGAGGLQVFGGSVWEVNSPAATFCGAHNGFLIDGQFAGNALDDSVSPGRTITGIPIPGAGGALLDTAISAGGFGGRAIGRDGSVITTSQAQTTTPLLSGPQGSGQVTTPGAAQTTALTYAMPPNTGGSYLAMVTARNTSTNKSANSLIAFGAQNLAGAVAVLGTPQNLLTFANAEDASLAGVSAAIGASGGNILVQVTGLAATSIKWSVTLLGVSA